MRFQLLCPVRKVAPCARPSVAPVVVIVVVIIVDGLSRRKEGAFLGALSGLAGCYRVTGDRGERGGGEWGSCVFDPSRNLSASVGSTAYSSTVSCSRSTGRPPEAASHIECAVGAEVAVVLGGYNLPVLTCVCVWGKRSISWQRRISAIIPATIKLYVLVSADMKKKKEEKRPAGIMNRLPRHHTHLLLLIFVNPINNERVLFLVSQHNARDPLPFCCRKGAIVLFFFLFFFSFLFPFFLFFLEVRGCWTPLISIRAHRRHRAGIVPERGSAGSKFDLGRVGM